MLHQLLINHKQHGLVGGDLKSISNKEDATHNPESKMSPCMKRLVKTYNWKDSFRILHPEAKTYSKISASADGGPGSRVCAR